MALVVERVDVEGDSDAGAKGVHDGVLQVDRHSEPLDHELVPDRRDGCDASCEADEVVGARAEDSGALAHVVLNNSDRTALYHHADPLEGVEPLAAQPEEQRTQVRGERLAERHGSRVSDLEHPEGERVVDCVEHRKSEVVRNDPRRDALEEGRGLALPPLLSRVHRQSEAQLCCLSERDGGGGREGVLALDLAELE
eukprot:scaffold108979_cov33-Tisochrysis_lutea.AAC.2